MTRCPTCNKPGFEKATAMITVRLSKKLHSELKLLAADRHCSLNELCVSSLQQTLKESEGINLKGVANGTNDHEYNDSLPTEYSRGSGRGRHNGHGDR